MAEAPEQKRVTIKQIEVSAEYCRDVMVTCVGGGSNFWARFRNIARDETLDIHSFEVAEIEEPCAKDGWTKIDVEEIRRGVALVCSSDFKVSSIIKTSILEDDNDAESSDVILQAAVFGKIIFG